MSLYKYIYNRKGWVPCQIDFTCYMVLVFCSFFSKKSSLIKNMVYIPLDLDEQSIIHTSILFYIIVFIYGNTFEVFCLLGYVLFFSWLLRRAFFSVFVCSPGGGYYFELVGGFFKICLDGWSHWALLVFEKSLSENSFDLTENSFSNHTQNESNSALTAKIRKLE